MNAILQGNGQKKGIDRRLPGSTGTGGTTTSSPPIEKFEFFYSGDHLGSSNFITDDLGAVYQELEYFPYGETWVNDGGTGQVPNYQFTGQELDPETGLYYYGARYYDPVLSKWISADPILMKYLPTGNRARDEKLAGFGGVYNPANLGLYGYAHLNPLTYIDPNGAETSTPVFNFKYTQGVQLGVTLGQRGGVSLKLSVNIARTEESLLTGEKATSQSIDFPKIGFGKWWFGIHGERSNSRHPDPRQYYANGDPVPFTGETVFDVLSNRKFEWTFFGENELGGKGKFSGGDFILELGYEAPLLPSFEGSINVSAGLRKLNLTGSPNISSVPNVGAPTNKFGGAPSGGTGIDPYLSTRPTTPSSN